MTAARVLALLPYPIDRVPGQRFRIEQWARPVERLGVQVTFSPFLSPRAMDVLYQRGRPISKTLGTLFGYGRRLYEMSRLGQYDVAFLYREAALLGPPIIERIVARRLPLVFDFDDAIYVPASSAANRWARWLKDPAKADKLCRLAGHVTVGNETLAQHARPISRAVTVIPTTIDTDLYQVSSRPPNAIPVVGWSGSTTTLPYLQAMGDVLRRLSEQARFRLLVIGGRADVPGVEVECRPWRSATEVEDLRSMDVGLMPLDDDIWARGKCGLKALQYMALGIPPVVSPVGVNATIVQDGVNGFHATTPSEWIDKIGRLLADPNLRLRLGSAARRTVELGYSARVQAPRVASVLQGMLPGDRG